MSIREACGCTFNLELHMIQSPQITVDFNKDFDCTNYIFERFVCNLASDSYGCGNILRTEHYYLIYSLRILPRDQRFLLLKRS
ncbi:unnamed protein product [Lactuca virosa]|uniref:Uncharacterized protein n=1 Tax=Lactuca virosa TaxID=75947 RepID=A0AAU9LPA0_9ASTR|nr:unnamed protein product [Lactuca virosa]